jgi:hypothetical protein
MIRGDYRTGKRINMKRVIGYIASGYTKDTGSHNDNGNARNKRHVTDAEEEFFLPKLVAAIPK